MFNQSADALCWLSSNNYAIEILMQYLDDFFLANEADSDKCRLQMEIIKQVFAWLGLSLASDKIIGSITCLVFLGILIDTITMAVCPLKNWKNYCHCWNSGQVAKNVKNENFCL